MALTDYHDVFIGSTFDGHTFLVLNRPIPQATRMLTNAGFTARRHHGRTIYLLPPDTAEDAHERAGVAAYGLMAYTQDLVDLAWTTRRHDGDQDPSQVTFRFADGAVTATATTAAAHDVLVRHGFLFTDQKRHYLLPDALSERTTLSAVVSAEAHLHTDGVSVHVDLGIPTVEDIPPAPPRPHAAPVVLPTHQTARHTR
ncbi:hypothetical protein J7I94_01970 [Streptomyces sp. ISL-12]|uniref:hypothetical protein n=1 Tax=Streptomyces sp. ISL-12 TaxID=2819177 RepID=UPI001BE7AF5B|nr:hypothetical protein [Streptomyces sp. ISL-12]MBT2409338.1 hypothetical protein [Streptomyces sp. ISL-12]